jgi:hypothetical protein
VKEYKRK